MHKTIPDKRNYKPILKFVGLTFLVMFIVGLFGPFALFVLGACLLIGLLLSC